MLQKINKVRQLLIILVFIELSIVIALSVLGYDLWYFVTVILVVVQIAMYIYLADKFDHINLQQVYLQMNEQILRYLCHLKFQSYL